MSNNWYASSTQGLTLNVTPTEPIKNAHRHHRHPLSGDEGRTVTGLVLLVVVLDCLGWVGQIIIDKTIVWESSGDQGRQRPRHWRTHARLFA